MWNKYVSILSDNELVQTQMANRTPRQHDTSESPDAEPPYALFIALFEMLFDEGQLYARDLPLYRAFQNVENDLRKTFE